MTAPSAPVIRCHTDGSTVRVAWQPVQDATDYKLYVGSSSAPTGLEADVADDDLGPSGWFQYTFREAGDVYVRVTALNVTAEESGYSNESHLYLTGPGSGFGNSRPSGLRA